MGPKLCPLCHLKLKKKQKPSESSTRCDEFLGTRNRFPIASTLWPGNSLLPRIPSGTSMNCVYTNHMQKYRPRPDLPPHSFFTVNSKRFGALPDLPQISQRVRRLPVYPLDVHYTVKLCRTWHTYTYQGLAFAFSLSLFFWFQRTTTIKSKRFRSNSSGI